MAQARRTKESNNLSGLTIHISRGLREAALFVLLAIAMFLLTALVTYHIEDPGWSHTGPREAIHNAAGVVGAWFADVLFYLMGYLAFLFPIMIAYSGWLVLRGRTDDGEIDFKILGLRWLGFFMTLVTGCALASLHFVVSPESLPLDGGGIIGRWLGDDLASVLGLLGSTLLLLAVFLAGITVFSGLSWLGVMDMIGAGMLKAYDWVHGRVRQSIEYRQELKQGEEAKQKRVEVVKEAEKKKEQRKKPVRIEPTIKKVELSERHNKEKQIALFDDVSSDSELPPLRLLNEAIKSDKGLSTEALEALSRLVELKLKDFNIILPNLW